MTQTSPQPTERLTSRQRRIEEQRRKIDAARAKERNRRLIWLGGIVVVVALAVAALVLLMPRSASGQMRQVTTEAGTHLEEGAPLPPSTWSHRPPSSGAHYGTLPQPYEYRMYETPLTPGRWIHMLEHGAVVVLYRQDLCDAACVQQLGAFFDSAPRSTLVPSVRHLAITPYQDMDHAVAVVAWGYVDEMDQVDKDRIMADFRSKVDASSAPEAGAM